MRTRWHKLHQNSVQLRDVHDAMHPKAIGGNRVLDELYDARIKILKKNHEAWWN